MWLQKLKNVKDRTLASSKATLADVPALKLFDFYKSIAADPAGRKSSTDVMQLKLDVSQTAKLSKTLSREGLCPLGGDDAVRRLKGWDLTAKD